MESVRTPPSAPQGTAAARPTRQGSKAAGNDSLGNAQGPQDAFAALLAALGQDALQMPLDTPAGTDLPAEFAQNSSTPGQQNGLGEGSLAGLQGQRALSQPSSDLPLQMQSLSTISKLPLDTRNTAGDFTALSPTSLVAQTTLMDKALDVAYTPTAPESGGTIAGKGVTTRWMGFAGAPAASVLSGTRPSAALSATLQSVATLVGNTSDLPLTPASLGVAPPSAEASTATQPGTVFTPQGEATTAQAVLAQTLIPSEARTAQASGPQPPKEGDTSLGAVTAGGESSAQPLHAVPDGSSVTTDGTQGATEDLLADQLAEQMSYWVSQDGQSAQLTLDRDGEPVQVRVVLSGNEAHVTFASDQVQTREALDASSAQLRDMLQAQGLVLAGVTVGQGGTGQGSTQQEASLRQGTRQGRPQGDVSSVGTLTQDRLGRMQASTGQRGLDIFV